MAKELNSDEKNVVTMQNSLQQLGITDMDARGLPSSLPEKLNPYSMGAWVMKDDDKIKLQIKFRPSFSVEHFMATFVPKLPIDQKTISGIDTGKLDEKMKNADWYFAHSETPQDIEKELKKIDGIENDIHRLIKDPEGLRIATILWNNNVPFYTATKPPEIRDYEEHSDLYLTKIFNWKTTIEQAHLELGEAFQSGQRNEMNFVEQQEVSSLGTPGNRPEIKIVAEGEIDSIKELIRGQQLEGMNWVAFDGGAPVMSQHHLNFFESKFDVSEFVHENSTDRDFFLSMSIQDLGVQLDKWVNLRNHPGDLVAFLEEKMKHADWNYRNADHYERFYQGEKEVGQINYLSLLTTNEIGVEKTLALWNKYVPEGTIAKPDFLTINKEVMTEKELAQPKIQLARIGVAEAYSENLINRMKNGEKEIQDPFSVKYKNGDEAKAVFHWKKSEDSNLYFLNKWDLSVKKNGQEKEVNNTFYINDPKRLSHVVKNPDKFVTTFTFKGAVNYLCERPVENLYRNRNDQQYLQWDSAKVLPNGKLQERHFHPNYGFDLKKVSDEYRSSIKDLANPEHAERFYQSLKRGNFQSAAFVEKNGKETSLLVTPNIPVGHFDIYTEYSKNAKPLTPEQQAEKGFISQDFALKVRERMNQMEQQVHKQGGASENNFKERQNQGVVAENKLKENQTGGDRLKGDQFTVPDKKQVESVGKKNNQRQKGSDDTGKPKRKVKPKVS